jgi:CheY-like chemotaxis protein
MSSQEVQIVVVDDDTVDIESVKRALAKRRIANPVSVFQDGRTALDSLRRRDNGAAIAQPYLILLDLNMPRMNGVEFLRELRADPAIQNSVVFVLTTSSSEKDIVESYALNVAGYIVKSHVGPDFVHLLDLLGCYWRVVELPGERQ